MFSYGFIILISLIAMANEALAAMARKETTAALNQIVQVASERMKNGYDRADN